jgi:ABC-type multidrug transport system ATPase subunit
MSEIVLETRQLTKRYKDITAVNDVNLSVGRGQIYGFLGPNGSGKTTSIGMILGLIHATRGEVRIMGHEVTPRQNGPLKQVGAMLGQSGFVPYLSGEENLLMLSRIHSIVNKARIKEVLAQVGLESAGKRKVGSYSLGMKQRLALGGALLDRPKILILDEPTNGLDPAGIREVRNLLRTLANEGTTVFLSSHLLHEVEQICDRVAVLSYGTVVAEGNVAELLERPAATLVRVPKAEIAARMLRGLEGVSSAEVQGNDVAVSGVSPEEVVAFLVDRGIIPSSVSTYQTDLESLFMEITKKGDDSLCSGQLS